MTNLQQALENRVTAFVNEITEITRNAARDIVVSALGLANGPAPAATSKAAKRAAPKASTKHDVIGATGGKGQKRDPATLVKVGMDLAAHISANPGQRIEQIKAAMKLDTKDLVLPIQKLMAAKTIRAEGTRRATKYFPVEKKAKK